MSGHVTGIEVQVYGIPIDPENFRFEDAALDLRPGFGGALTDVVQVNLSRPVMLESVIETAKADEQALGDLLGCGFPSRQDGSNGNDVFQDELGNDLITGGDGIDALDGDEGNDTLLGGAQNDSLT